MGEKDSKNLKIAIYIGHGASYSWIWFVKTFDSLDYNEVYFLDDFDIRNGELSNFDCLVLPGGDPFLIAEGLNEDGLDKIRQFVFNGGSYIGVCAGTYLSIIFNDDPMPWLNLAQIRINNFSTSPPEAIRMKYKYLVPYREGYVFHPVRGSLEVGNKDLSFKAPLYGGPPMIAPAENRLLDYVDFDEKTLYLIDEDVAKSTMVGNAAGIRVPIKKGCLYLFGPHFEHPSYPEANMFLNGIMSNIKPLAPGPAKRNVTLLHGDGLKEWMDVIKRELSSARVLSNGLMNLKWKIGEKVWEDEKIVYFLNETWKTLKSLQRYDALPIESPKELEVNARHIHSLLAEIRVLSKEGEDTNVQAEKLIDATKKLSKGLFDAYFDLKRNIWWSNGKIS